MIQLPPRRVFLIKDGYHKDMKTLFLLLFPLFLGAANFKLFLKDGTSHIVREYQVQTDRVRYYSTERSDWEEIPLELVDLKRTEKEIKDRADSEKEQAKLIDEEEKAERALAREISKVPQDPGAYYLDGEEIRPLKLGDAKVNTKNKRRSILKAVSPIPMVSDKGALELDGETSAFVIKSKTPEFYFRLTEPERFGLIRITPAKGLRIVEKITIVPVSKEVVEERELIEIFRRQAGPELYKIWPMEPLTPGEYAVVQYTEGKINIQIYDFAIKPE